MGFRTLDLDNKDQANEYKKNKQHNKFVKESRQPVEEKKEEVQTDISEEEPAKVVEEVKPVIENGAPVLYGKVIKIDRLRIRKEPEGDVIGFLNKDEEVKILSDVNDVWYKVITQNGVIGCCMKNFLYTYSETVGVNDLRRCKTCPTTL